jgi:hypothetical protein
MIKALGVVLLLSACGGQAPPTVVGADAPPELRAVQVKLDQCSRMAADMAATHLKHLREDREEAETHEAGYAFPAWPFEWPEGWQKVELVCPTAKHDSRCKTVEWFHDHPEAVSPNGKMKKL